MTIVYVTSGPWGPGQGQPLSAAQADGNFYDHELRIEAIELLSPGVGISTITQPTPNTIKITLTSGANFTFTLPTLTLNFRGAWLPSTHYAPFDVFEVASLLSVYMVLVDHTSAATFDPNATDGLGHNLYGLLLSVPNMLPTGGTTDQVLVKNSTTNYDVKWQSSGMPHGGAAQAALFKNSATDFDATFRAATFGDITGSLSTAQVRLPTVTPLGTTGTVLLDPTVGDVFTMTPMGNVTLNAASAPAGARITLVVTTSGTSSFNVTPSSNFISTGALATGIVGSKRFTISFVGDGTNFYETSRTTAM